MSTIHVQNLSKAYHYYEKDPGFRSSLRNLLHRKTLERQAVKGISFEIEEGEMVGFLGPNGAGKTTTLKMLSGILHPTSGEASVLGYTPWKRQKAFKMQFSIVMGQKSQLWWDLPVNESLYLNKSIYEVDDQEYQRTLDELTELLDVRALLTVQVRRLSLGERMKMELIAALIHRPRVLFLDEPTIGLDLTSQARIRQFLKYYNEQDKTTVVLTSHYMRDIEELCKRTIVINQGVKVYDGSLRDVHELVNERKIIKLRLSEKVTRFQMQHFGNVEQVDDFNVRVEVNRQDVQQYVSAMLQTLPIVDFNIEDIPLETAITMLYGKGAC
ncbi:MAG: ABC transporter ATP-binding protein [Alicyclobacillus sp.]|nr:ABC transporter ATP-binding protein [Alicyclobacillus sp.]